MARSVQQKGENLKYASDRLKDDKELVLIAVGYRSYNTLQYASPRLRDNLQVLQTAVNYNGQALKAASKRLRSNKNLFLRAVRKHPLDCHWIVDFAEPALMNNSSFISDLQNINGCAHALDTFNLYSKVNQKTIYALVKKDSLNLKFASKAKRDDKRLVMLAVKKNAVVLQYASKRLKDDKEVISACNTNGTSALEYASMRLRDNEEVVLEQVRRNSFSLQYASKRLKKNRKIAIAAINKYIYAFDHVDNSLKKDKGFVVIALRKSDNIGQMYKFVALLSQKDKVAALKEAGKEKPGAYLLARAASNKKSDVLAAVSKKGDALQLAIPQFKKDKQIVLAAMRQSGEALAFADKSLLNDKTLLEAAIKTSPSIIYYLTNQKILKLNKQLVLTALKESGFHFSDLNHKFKRDKEIVLAAIHAKSDPFMGIDKDMYIDDDVINALIDQNLKKSSLSGAFLLKYLSYLSKPIHNKQRLLRMLRKNGLALEYASLALKNDRNIVQTAINQNGNAIAFASPFLKKDKSLASNAINKSAEAYDYIDDRLKTDLKFARPAAYKGNKHVLKTLYSLLESHATRRYVIDSTQWQLPKDSFITQKTKLSFDKIPPFYSDISNFTNAPIFIISGDGSRIAGILKLRPQGVSQLAIWNTKNGKLLYTTRLSEDMNVYSHFRFTPDNKRLVAIGKGMVWSFAKHKKPIFCRYLESTFTDLTNNAVLAHPADWVDGIYDLNTCEPIVWANTMNVPRTLVIGRNNKMLHISYQPLTQSHKDILLYRKKPEHLEHRRNFKNKVSLWEVPFTKKASTDSLGYQNIRAFTDSKRKQLLVLRLMPDKSMEISKWSYSNRSLLWKKKIKNLVKLSTGLTSDYFIDSNFPYQQLHLGDKRFIYTFNLKNGNLIKKIPADLGKYNDNYFNKTPLSKRVTKALLDFNIETDEVRPDEHFTNWVSTYMVDSKNRATRFIDSISDREITLWKVKTKR